MLLGVDVGGTFTDAVLLGEDGVVHTAKAPSTPSRESEGVLAAIHLVLSRAGAEPREVRRFAHGMTVATNALLEGRCARTALVATSGFTDVLELGRQNRAHLYRLCQAAPSPLVPAELRFAAPERMGPDGPLKALQEGDARALIELVAQAEPQAVAVALLHSYRDPAHERLLGALLGELLPDVHISLSCDVVGTFREYERTATTVLDAALSPLLGDYLGRLTGEAKALGLPEPQVMQSSGGLTSAARAGEHAALTVLSGPAGGVGGALLLAELTGEPDVLCFDMGGTSCDVCLIEDSLVAETAERTIAGRPLSLPALDIHTVGAGGGSIAWRDSGGALRVGPASAGALPGPACYGRGGTQATVTDANLILGRLLEDVPLPGGLELDREAAVAAISKLGSELGLGLIACAEGIVRVAEAEMLGALRVMSVERGIDPRRFALMPFGGAGPLHAAALARGLGISRVLCPRTSGVLCALGLAAAAPRRDLARTASLRGDSFSAERLGEERETILAEALSALDCPPAHVRIRHELRYAGQSFELPVHEDLNPAGEARWLDPRQLQEAFACAHERRYGYREDSAEVELVNIRASLWGAAPALSLRGGATKEQQNREVAAVVFAGEHLPSAIFRGEPPPGVSLVGPALCALPESSLLIPPGWSGQADQHGTIHLSYEERA
jgi:N-methylhydantoinase A